VERLETAIRFNMPVYFGFDEDEIRAQDRGVLDRFAQVVKEYYPVSLVTVEGFTDPSGSAAYNKRLGMRRAESVKSYLVQANGLSPDLLRTVSYGEEVARQIREGQRGPGNEGWENRRVVLVIDHGGTGPS
jgi:peptidoglycan-associated lipoprotein